MNLHNKNILITGASSGIGRELAVQLSAKGCNLALIARRKNLLEELTSVIKTNDKKIFTYKCDVSVKDEVAAVIGKIEKDLGSINAAILSAGIGRSNRIGVIHSADAEKIFDVNVIGLINIVEAMLPILKRQDEGTIVGISSLAEARGFPGSGFYCASKAAASKLLESMRIELKKFNIKVITVKPGFVKTPMTENNKFKMPFLMNVKKAAKLIINGIEREKRIIQFPLPMVISAKLSAAIPDSIFDYFASKQVGKHYRE